MILWNFITPFLDLLKDKQLDCNMKIRKEIDYSQLDTANIFWPPDFINLKITFEVLSVGKTKIQKVPPRFEAFLCMSKYTNTQFKFGHRMKIGESGFKLCSGNKAPNILSVTVLICKMGSAPNKTKY